MFASIVSVAHNFGYPALVLVPGRKGGLSGVLRARQQRRRRHQPPGPPPGGADAPNEPPQPPAAASARL
jgi:hypothetical protein